MQSTSILSEVTVTLGESSAGCPHFQITVKSPSSTENGTIQILSTQDPSEVKVLREHLFVKSHDGELIRLNFDTENKALIPNHTAIYFDGQLIGMAKDGIVNFQKVTLPEARMIGEYNDTKTIHETTPFHQSLTQAHKENHSHSHKEGNRRIDGHTHFISAFPMKLALERSIALTGSVHIPSLVVLKILQDKGLMNDKNAKKWIAFLNDKKVLPTDDNFKQKKDYNSDLLGDFVTVTPHLTQEEKSACLNPDTQGYYVDVSELKKKLGEVDWGHFCNGFDLDATHLCDFTEHMEMAYNVRNWYGKDSTFLRAQLEVMYEEYERQGIDYAEVPSGSLKKPEELLKFVAITKEIEAKRKQEGKPAIILRPGLSIARLLPPIQFRQTLFNFIPLIIQYPEIASVTVLAHETNPTTEHLLAIRDFIKIINAARPGFTVEVHAGETSTYGEVNMNEARFYAEQNPLVVLRAGHANYGSHTRPTLDNFFEEKCPLSNMTLIDVEPSVQVNVLLGIAEGRSNIFWGSDGAIYNPEYAPAKQQEIYINLISHPTIIRELEARWKNNDLDRFNTTTFKDYQQVLAEKLISSLKKNELNEDNYINFKQNEMLYHDIRMTVAKLNAFHPIANSEELHEILKFIIAMHKVIIRNSYTDFNEALANNTNNLVLLSQKAHRLFDDELTIFLQRENITEADKPKLLAEISLAAVEFMRATTLSHREAVEFYNKLIKLVSIEPAPSEAKELLEMLRENPIQVAFRPNSKPNFFDRETQHDLPLLEVDVLDELVEAIRTIPPGLKSRIDRMTVSPLAVGDSQCEMFLDPYYFHHKVAALYHKKNNEFLTNNASSEKIPLGARVIFGNPERSSDNEIQKEYMVNLYKNLFVALDQAKEGIVLLGGLDEGINPLIYKILNDHYEHFKHLKIHHVVANDENVFSVDVKLHKNILGKRAELHDGVVPYIIANKHRQEAHIGYADFVQQNQLSDIMMFGGETAIWSDTKNAMADRRLNNHQKVGYLIKFYSGGFGDTRSSSEYAKGSPQQSFDKKNEYPPHLDTALLEGLNAEHLLSPVYTDAWPKTASYHRNLQFAFNALQHAFETAGVSLNLTLEQFMSAYNPLDISTQPGNIKTLPKEQAQAAVRRVFEEFFSSSNAKPALVKNMYDIFSMDNGFGVIRQMDKHFPEYSLEQAMTKFIGLHSTTPSPMRAK